MRTRLIPNRVTVCREGLDHVAHALVEKETLGAAGLQDLLGIDCDKSARPFINA